MFTQGTTAELTRVLITGNRMAGIAASGWGRSPETRVVAKTLVVRDTRPSECGELPEDDPLSCSRDGRSGGGGAGVIGQQSARVALEDFAISGSAAAGLVAGRDATVRATGGRVVDNEVGLAIWQEDYDVDGLFTDVFLFDNALDVAVEDLSVPTPSAALGDALGADD